MPTNINKNLFQKAAFTFRGTVQKLNAANIAQIKDTDRTAIVLVEEIIKSPEMLASFAGQPITVKLSEGETVKKGERAIFYTNGWLFGETIAVESLGHSPVEAGGLTLAASVADPVKTHKEDIIKKRLKTADAVVTGRVTSVRLPTETLAAKKISAAAGEDESEDRRPISEHDPEWCEAVVEVADVEKGSDKKKEIVVRFPNSNDVRWYKAHKFTAGEEGVFILHKTAAEAKPASRRIAATVTKKEAETTEEAYTALHPEDFQPLQNSPEIKTLIKDIE